MPKIPRVQVPNTSVGPVGGPSTPSVSPLAFGAASGQALERTGGTLQKATDVLMARAEQNEVSDLSARFAEVRNNATKEIERLSREETQRLSQGGQLGDEELVSKSLEDFDREAEALRQKVNTRAGQLYFDREFTDARAGFERSLMATQAELRGVKAEKDHVDWMTATTSQLLRDPYGLDDAVRRLGDSLATKNLTAKQAAAFQTKGAAELAQSSVRGFIRQHQDPRGVEKVVDALKAGTWSKYLDADAQLKLEGEAKDYQRALTVEAERKAKVGEEARKKRIDTAVDKHLQGIYANTVSATDILKDPVLEGEWERKERLMGIMRQRNSADAPPDMTTVTNLFSRIKGIADTGGPPVTTEELDRAYASGKLGTSPKFLDMLRRELGGLNDPAKAQADKDERMFLTSAKAAILKGSIFNPPSDAAHEKFLSFYAAYREEYDKARKAGVSLHELFNPKSPKSLWPLVGQYQMTMQETMAATRKSMGMSIAPAPTSAPGETPKLPGQIYKSIDERNKAMGGK